MNEQDKQYANTLKRFLLSDKGDKKTRINIMEKKPQVVVQPKREEDVDAAKDKDKNQIQLIKDSDSDSSTGSNEFLNEEERSLIVDEILKANNEEEFVLEDDSPDKRDTDVNDDFGSVATKSDHAFDGTNVQTQRATGGKFKVIIKSAKEQKIRTLTKAKLVQQYNIELKKRPKMEDAFEDGVLSAHKMHIVKHSKKEKQGAKYLIQKENMREKVIIQRDAEGFQIIIPKTLKYGRADLAHLDMDEFLKNFNIFKLNFKDMLNLIKEEAAKNNPDGVIEGETIITKE